MTQAAEPKTQFVGKSTPPVRAPAPPRKPMTVVIYDPATGRIKETRSGSPKHIQACGLPYLEVAEHKHDYDVTHQVVNGVLAPRDPSTIADEQLARAWKKLRVKRDSLLATTVDVYNAARWATMSAANQEAVKVYRKALLDIMTTTKDPLNPVWPTLTLGPDT